MREEPHEVWNQGARVFIRCLDKYGVSMEHGTPPAEEGPECRPEQPDPPRAQGTLAVLALALWGEGVPPLRAVIPGWLGLGFTCSLRAQAEQRDCLKGC